MDTEHHERYKASNGYKHANSRPDSKYHYLSDTLLVDLPRRIREQGHLHLLDLTLLELRVWVLTKHDETAERIKAILDLPNLPLRDCIVGELDVAAKAAGDTRTLRQWWARRMCERNERQDDAKGERDIMRKYALDPSSVPVSDEPEYEPTYEQADLSHADLRGADLRLMDLEGFGFVGANLTKADLSGAVISHSMFCGAWLDSAVLDDADISESNFNGSYCLYASFDGATLNEVHFVGAMMCRASFEETLFIDVDLTGARLEEAYLPGARLTNSTSIVRGTNFRGAYMPNAHIGDASGSLFIDANLEGASFRCSDVDGAIFTRARLKGADLRAFTFAFATLHGADLTDARLSDMAEHWYVTRESRRSEVSIDDAPFVVMSEDAFTVGLLFAELYALSKGKVGVNRHPYVSEGGARFKWGEQRIRWVISHVIDGEWVNDCSDDVEAAFKAANARHVATPTSRKPTSPTRSPTD